LLFALIVTPAGAQDQSKDFLKLPQQQAERELPSSHPANFLVYASRRFQEGAKEDAVLWFYVGEIRYRFYLAVNPNLPPDGDPALFGSLHESVGSVINGWAGADPNAWAKQMGRALEWDAANDNQFTSKTAHAKEWQETRSGLETLKNWVLTNKEHILEERKKHGL
jgi:hypothetical protein